jgi:hypothetical protein
LLFSFTSFTSPIPSWRISPRNIDSLISRSVPEISKKNIAKYLNEADFTHVFKDVDIPATESFVKEIDGVEVEIEFLTDSATRNDKNKNVVIAGIVVQPLSYLMLSSQTTMEFRTYLGKAGKVVSPGAGIFHKGLTFTKRKSPSKCSRISWDLVRSHAVGGFFRSSTY